MPQENEANLVDPSENPGEEVVDPSEQDAAAAAAAAPQLSDENPDGPYEDGDGPNR